jgi:hypothetical protein
MTIDEMITGLRAAGLESYAGPAEYQGICTMIREDVPAIIRVGMPTATRHNRRH